MPVARVHDKYLLQSEINSLFLKGQHYPDSADIARSYIEKWVTRQLLTIHAELNLPKEKKDFSKQIDDYRTALLLYQYQKELISQKLDTVITPEDVKLYYDSNSAGMLLDEIVVKARYAVFLSNQPGLKEAYKNFKSVKPDDITRFYDYAYQYSENFSKDENKWISIVELSALPGFPLADIKTVLQRNRFLELSDSIRTCFIEFTDYRMNGEVAPLEYWEMKIKSIILNKRRIAFIEEMENEIYRSAQAKNEFEIY